MKLQIGNGKGTYSTQTSGSDVLVKVGKGTINLKNAYVTTDNININGKSIKLEHKAITMTSNNDKFKISRDSISVDGEAGNDSITNSYDVSFNTINGGKGNDTIENYGNNITINGDKGNDYIYNGYHASFISINGGDGNDSIENDYYTSLTTIIGGKGNDSIDNSGNSVLFKYTTGDGNDIIYGFNETSTLSIGGGSYSTKKSGDNIIVTVGTGKIFLMGAASLETLNTIENSGFKVTIQSFAGNDILTGGAGNDTITDYNNGDKISTTSDYENYSVNDKDLIFNFGDANSLTIQDGASKQINLNSNANYYTTDGVLDKNKKFINLLATIETFKADSKVMTIDGSATGAIEITGNKKKNYIVAGANGSTLNGGKGNDTLVGGAGADLFVYNNKTGKDVIASFSVGDSISLDSSVTIKDAKTKSGNNLYEKNYPPSRGGFFYLRLCFSC